MTGAIARASDPSLETATASDNTADQLRLLRRQDQLALRGHHGAEWADFSGRSRLLLAKAAALAHATVMLRFAPRWADLLKHRDDPAFVARSDALKAEEAAELARQTSDSLQLIKAERRAAAALMKDRHRRERSKLAERHRATARYLIPVARFPVLATPTALIARSRDVYFAAAGGLVTRRAPDPHFAAGVPRLVFRRTGRPRR